MQNYANGPAPSTPAVGQIPDENRHAAQSRHKEKTRLPALLKPPVLPRIPAPPHHTKDRGMSVATEYTEMRSSMHGGSRMSQVAPKHTTREQGGLLDAGGRGTEAKRRCELRSREEAPPMQGSGKERPRVQAPNHTAVQAHNRELATRRTPTDGTLRGRRRDVKPAAPVACAAPCESRCCQLDAEFSEFASRGQSCRRGLRQRRVKSGPTERESAPATRGAARCCSTSGTGGTTRTEELMAQALQTRKELHNMGKTRRTGARTS